MAEKLSVQIALEGGKEIEAQLADIGKAGQKAFKDISAAAAEAGGFDKLDPGQATKSMEKFGITGEAAISKITDAVKTASRFETMVNIVKAVENAFTSLGVTVGKVITIMAKHEAASAGLGRAGVAAATTIAGAFGPIGIIITVIIGALLILTTAFLRVAQSINAIDAQARTLGSSFEAFSKLRQGLLAAGIPLDAINQGLAQLQSNIDKFKLDAVEAAFAKAQKNVALGWGPGEEQLEKLRKAADGVGPAAERARQALDTLGRPFEDNVTPALESMVRWAGTATKAIPLIAGELARMGTAGERARLIEGILQQIAAESGGAVAGMKPLLEALEQMPKGAARNKAAIDLFGQALGTAVTQGLDLGKSISQIIQDSEGMKQSQADAANNIVQNWNRIKAAMSTAFDNLPIEKLNSAMGTVATTATSAFGTATTAIGTMSSAMDGLIQKINDAIAAMSQLSSAGGRAGGTATDTSGGFAGGGMIGGRGSGTSDSNLAWVSRGEYITPARAVAQPGVLAFLEALRRTGGDLSSVMRGMGRFALGGLVTAPAFASGGLSGMSHVTIAFPGLPPIGGLRASSSVVDELHRAAAMAQVRSGGRKPSRYF